MDKMKTNQDGGSVTAKDSSAAGKQLEKNQAGAAKYKHGAADGHMKGEKKEGAAKYKGAHDYDTSKGSHDHPHGAAKMGYSQSFGAARVNGYAKGAAKVANIMSFGASKYMKHGAADKGHGGPEGHTHPTMTLSSRETSGGGSSSSSSNTTGGGSSSSRQSTDNLKNYQAGLVDLGSDFKPTAEQTRAANARVAELKKKDADAAAANAANATSSSSSSNTTNAGSSTTTSNTTTSPNSMAEALLQGNIQQENRNQQFNFDREEANIAATIDSTKHHNRALDRLPRFRQNTPSGQRYAGRAGGRAAASSRRDSGLFSSAEITQMYRDGQDPEKK
jgi:uncharacterized protein YdeI (BOF family)